MLQTFAVQRGAAGGATKQEAARAHVASLIDTAPRPWRFFVRPNPFDTGMTADDLAAVVKPGLDGLLVPKADGASDIVRIGAMLDELEAAIEDAFADPAFHEERALLARDFIGRPTPMYFAERLTEDIGGARIWLKREDLAHTGAHKINNALGQALIAKRLGKQRIVAETGAGQHGVATATVCARFGLQAVVYMGEEDMRRQRPNVVRMRFLGAEVIPVTNGAGTLKDALNDAIRDWITNVETTHYMIGTAAGPHPYPYLVRRLQAVIGEESRAQMLDRTGQLPDAVVACIGGGSNAIGIFHPFRDEHAALMTSGRAEYVGVSDEEALVAFDRLCRLEGIIPALETSHALVTAERLAKELGPDANIVVGLSGRGDKDVDQIAARRDNV